MDIKFIATSRETELVVERPVPAKEAIADWYKEIPRFMYGNKGPIIDNGEVVNNTVKACMPFYDSISSGYIQRTWCDIHINFEYDNNNLIGFNYNLSSSPQIIDYRKKLSVKLSEDFHQAELLWRIPWTPVLPKGWSALLVSPLNRMDLPFISSSAIIDSDVFHHNLGGAYPVYFKKFFNDKIIPAGTPMYQIIPIKRENWKSMVHEISDEDRIINSYKMKKNFIGVYKRFFHQKKKYE